MRNNSVSELLLKQGNRRHFFKPVTGSHKQQIGKNPLFQ